MFLVESIKGATSAPKVHFMFLPRLIQKALFFFYLSFVVACINYIEEMRDMRSRDNVEEQPSK